eukprot:CAMPEP_0178476862 /NCGR_PEP_ID=MMETSP0696-20121128/3841_1 /TAXON_ID=265572 /ORGANISM="Extubocellulus spinifer, Strain CCMP396" /LENGTH=613 /DNA_ID=CAMNT_0020104169 /DNA_START=163 /DNA_END=2004 /DNA_ORIENTATION=+
MTEANADAKESHRIKSISFLSSPRHILLQNKNGPCPLLAAANALLLRGVITLPGRCISAGQISIDDVVNILAERTVAKTGQHAASASATTVSDPVPATTTVAVSENKTDNDEKNESSSSEAEADAEAEASAPPSPSPLPPQKDSSPRASAALHAQHHLHEVLSLFPSLQYGMDVNPKFTSGPTGVEFTTSMTCFDLLGVELVHGWLLDPQDVETASVIGDKTYNELVELVIKGNDAGDEVDKLGKMIAAKEAGAEIAVPVSDSRPHQPPEAAEGAEDDQQQQEEKEEEKKKLHQPTMDELRQKHREQSDIAHEGHLVNSFLTSTSHQLTYHGLHELHNHLSDHSLCVFFRNNHFATLTKQDGNLWLLVTDLGYANVPEVVWEKLDAIDGSTTLYDEYFSVPEPRSSMGATAGPTLSSAEVAGQCGQVDADRQLALQLSKHPDGAAAAAGAPGGGRDVHEKEGQLMAAATEASIKDWHNAKQQVQGDNVDTKESLSSGVVAVGIPAASPPNAAGSRASEKQNGLEELAPPPPASSASSAPLEHSSFVPSDEAIARALQAQMNSDQDSEALARQLQAEEDAAARQRRQQQQQTAAAPQLRSTAGKSSSSDKCVIS